MPVFKLEDSKTGKIYQLEADDGATEAEAMEYLGTLDDNALTQYEMRTAAPAAPTAVSASRPSAMLGGRTENTVATKELEEVPGAREFLTDQFWNNVDNDQGFGVAQKAFNERFPGVALPATMAGAWAENRAYAQTPEGRAELQRRTPIAPVNRPTGVDDVEAPDSWLEEFGMAGKKALYDTANAYRGAAALGADLVGAEETAQHWLDDYLEQDAANRMNMPTSTGSASDIDSLGEAAMYSANVLGSLVPDVLMSLGIGVAGGVIGKQAVKGIADKIVERELAAGATEEVAKRAAAQVIEKATVRGGVAAATGQSMVQESGTAVADTYAKTGEVRSGSSLAAGIVSGALEAVFPARILTRIGGQQGVDALTDSLVKKIGKDAVEGVFTEGVPEALQSIITQLPAGQPINWDEVTESFIRGGLGGSVLNTGVGVIDRTLQSRNTPSLPSQPRTGVPEGQTSISVPQAVGRRSAAFKKEIAQTVSEVDARVKHLASGWQNAPEIETHQNFSKLKNVPNNAVGVYTDGKLLVNTETLVKHAKQTNRTVDQVVSSLTYHEGLGHHGLALEFGNALDDKLSTMLANSPTYQAKVNAWLKKNPDAYEGDNNRDLRAFEELLAERSENGQLPTSVVSQLKNVVKDFGRRMGVDLQYSTREVETILAMAHSAVVNGKGRDVRGNGFNFLAPQKFMYAGQNAETANIARLEGAKAFLRAGVDKEEVRKKLGWFKGPDNKWRFEIDDSKVGLLDDAIDNDRYLVNVLDHPELFEAYPQLRGLQVTRAPEEFPTVNDTGFVDGNLIGIHPEQTDKQAVTILLHEVQHAVQMIEGFATGGMPDTAIQKLSDETLVKGARNYSRYLRKGKPDGWLASLTPGQREKLAVELDGLIEQGDIRGIRDFVSSDRKNLFDAYQHLFGEVEARDVEYRQSLTSEQRAEYEPYSMEPNIDPESYIFDMPDGSQPQRAEATVWHGSPHDFDQFTTKKMGSGEGHQAFGWGMYFAGKKALAEYYRSALAKDKLTAVVPSKFIPGIKQTKHLNTQQLGKRIVEHPLVVEAFEANEENSKPKPLEFASAWDDGTPQTYVPYQLSRRRIKYAADTMLQYMREDGLSIEQAEAKANEEFGGNSFYPAEHWALAGAVMKDLGVKVEKNGKLYEVDIPDKGYLLWDVPMDQQPQEIQEALAKDEKLSKFDSPGTQYDGADFYEAADARLGSPKKASQYLNSLGIVGIKYANGQTRNNEARNEEDYNYVVFSDEAPRVVNKYMMMSKPENVKFTPEEIQEMSPDELFESENAMRVLNQMTEGYEPIVMSFDELETEAKLRDLRPSTVLRKKGVGAGELVKRLYMYDIAMNKINDRLSGLLEKIQSGDYTPDDKMNFITTTVKQQELAARIFEDQGEIGRALAAMKTIQNTRRSVSGMQGTLQQFAQGSPFEMLNDEEAFLKFAFGIQDQIAAGKEKLKASGRDWAANAINLPRAIMSTLDLSAPLRQGLFLIHKGAWWKSFFNMFRYWSDEQAFKDLRTDIMSRPTYGEMLRAKLALSDIDGKLNSKEEDFQTEWAQKIPGFGKLVRMSERAYSGFLNKLRADVFDDLVAKLPEGYTDKDLQDLGRFINAASGRGNLPKQLQSSAPLLNAMLFSPRLMASRIVMTTALVDPRTYTTMNKTARNEYIKSILSVGSAALLILSLAAMGGAEVEEDPRSSDFAKIKMGNTRFDILGGESQYITLAARLLKNSTKTADGNIRQYGSEFGQTTRKDAVYKFVENKLAPVPSFVVDYLRGTNAIGEKFELDQAVASRFAPMFAMDMYENIDEHGFAKGASMTAPAFFGVGVQNYKSYSQDSTREIEAPVTFDMKTAKDGKYNNARVEDGTVILDDEAQKEWSRRLNTYIREWMKDEMAAPEWKTMTADERKAAIKSVRDDARKETKADMLELLQIEEQDVE